MTKVINVGASSKTPFKHWMLNVELGRQVGILACNPMTVPCNADPFLIIDMCAGNGEETEFSKETSVSIINHHAYFRGLDSQVVFIEKQPGTFSELEKNAGDNAELLNIDAKDYQPNISHPKQAVFVNCDPNSIDQIPLTSEFIEQLPVYSTLIITLGCNVAGIKRLVRERREEWFDYINMMKNGLTRNHDLLLTSVIRDSAQWAYLVRIPKVWSERSQVMYEKKGATEFNHGVDVYSWRRHRVEFDQQLNVLFLTRKENEHAA